MANKNEKTEDKIILYGGTVRYFKGIWSSDNLGKRYVAIDDSSKDSWEYSFENLPATSLNQLTQFVLPKKIQEEKNLDFPAYINWESGFANLYQMGSVPSHSSRFDNLVRTVDIGGDK